MVSVWEQEGSRVEPAMEGDMVPRRFAVVAGVLACLLMSGAVASFAAGEASKNKAVAQRVFDDILNHGRYELFAEIYTEDFVKHVDLGDSTLAQEREAAKAMRDASNDLVMTVDEMIAEGDRVAIRYTGRGTSTGPFNGMPPTGKKLAVTGMTIYRFSKGKIAEEWTTYNMLEILRQLGYYPDPGKQAK
jgi:steroid delta-isomerase-like uncharacterized protein